MATRLFIGFTWDGIPLKDEESIWLTLESAAHGVTLHVDAPFFGDPPPPGPKGSKDGLWNYEVVELFICGLSGLTKPTPYTEIELSPHGHHWVLKLLGERQVESSGLPLNFEAVIRGDRWHGLAEIPHEYLPEKPVRGNAFSVHGIGDKRRHCAMTPVGGSVPDFHRIKQFPALKVDGWRWRR